VAVLAYQLEAEDNRVVGDVVDDALRHARAPRFEEPVEDCGRTIVQAFGQDGGRAEIRCDHDQGGGWGRLFDQLRTLHEWADAGPAL
jgi:hypothetical protein